MMLDVHGHCFDNSPPNCGKMSAELIKEGLDLIQHTCTTKNVSLKPDQNAAVPLADCSHAVGGVEKQMEQCKVGRISVRNM